MDIKNSVFSVIKQDGTIFNIEKNDFYNNHYQYIDDLRYQNIYLMQMSFGLTFERDDMSSQIMFFQMLVDDGCVVLTNQSIYTTDKSYSVDFYLPSKISSSQVDFFKNQSNSIKNAKYVFLEAYDSDEPTKFKPLTSTVVDLTTGYLLLEKYIDSHKLFKIDNQLSDILKK